MSLDHNASLRDADPLVARLIDRELRRQRHGLELIASENFASRAVIDAMGTPLTNKYAEGYPGRRYYGGCEVIDEIEQLAIDRLKQIFGAEHANVQPHSGAQANFAAFMAVIKPGETHHGHVAARTAATSPTARRSTTAAWSGGRSTTASTRPPAGSTTTWCGSRPSRSGRSSIIAGGSAYARIIDFAAFRSIADEVGALFLVDMAHFAGLVAGGVHPSPVPHAQIVTSTTHKTLRGPRAGLILCTAEHAKAIDKSVFPGTQGGPLEHVIAAKAVAFGEALTADFKRLRPPGGGQRQGAGRGARSSAASPSSPGEPTRTSCWSTSGPRTSPARSPRRRSTRPGSRSTRTPFPTTPSRRSSPAASGSARPRSPRAGWAGPR